MRTMTMRRARSRAAIGTASLVAYLGAVAFPLAAIWYELVERRITVAPEPSFGPGQSPAERLQLFYCWLGGTLPQERLFTSIAIAGLCCLATAAVFARDLLGRERLLGRIGAGAIGAGALLWVAGSVAQLGGHRAVVLMAAHGNPIDAVNSIAFTVDTVDQAFELAAFALLGAGMLALARLAIGAGPRYRGWGWCAALLALLLLALAWSYAGDDAGRTDLLLLAGGVVLLPVWLVWTGRLLRAAPIDPDPGS
jgi:hypothetical protein